MKMELTEGSETSAYINQTLGNYPKGNLLYAYEVLELTACHHILYLLWCQKFVNMFTAVHRWSAL